LPDRLAPPIIAVHGPAGQPLSGLRRDCHAASPRGWRRTPGGGTFPRERVTAQQARIFEAFAQADASTTPASIFEKSRTSLRTDISDFAEIRTMPRCSRCWRA